MQISEPVKKNAESLGSEGAQWLKSLPHLLRQYHVRWGFIAEQTLHGGARSHVVAGQCRVGQTRCVLKIELPDGSCAGEAWTLMEADGKGYVRLLEQDLRNNAILVERGGISLHENKPAVDTQLRIGAELLNEAWLHVDKVGDGQAPIQTFNKATSLGKAITTQYAELLSKTGQPPVGDKAFAFALNYAEQLAENYYSQSNLVIAHGDPHTANTIEAPNGHTTKYVFIDPDGLLAPKAYDLGVLVRSWNIPLAQTSKPVDESRRHCRVVSEECNVDEEDIWKWGFLERVSTGLYLNTHLGNQYGTPFLHTADRIAEQL